MSNEVTNILISGVGGQGILLASEVLSEVLMLAGFDVKKNEIHGMSQRGGSVVSHIRYGKKVYSSIIPEGQADMLLGFELLETYRYLPLVRKGGSVLANNLQVFPAPVTLGKESYPVDIPAKIKAAFPDTKLVDGLQLASDAGNQRTVNVVLLGALSKNIDIDDSFWQQTLQKMVPAKYLEENLKAFSLGRNL
ncbi:indolepyruvate oxidoreductase subunit beta [Syntrophotalea acetylenivorans]|uniref:Indolepyruvate oxidoreductase subunit beta n=1 Tax=Syntrophotalea acetylenivorans TaxID=1842532 RepID=A0A1L3GLT7_9BACT|nr:indolepyruvate oxidoreductase subunit beta [Syntrophotalea acetylenivorans]APG26903.1 indolepyruvate oxidoreductase subunit beta [Syntrophotalea acetylenivorans]